VAVCLGASWIWSGHAGTLEALTRWVKPGGMVLVGEPHWKRRPSAEFLAAEKLAADDFGTHIANAEAGTTNGLVHVYSIVSTDDEWDRYEGLQWLASERYVREHPDDSDNQELLDKMHAARDRYLRWGREELGWATYLFLKP
jgi:hypothetical protein